MKKFMLSFRLKILVVFCCFNQLSAAQTIDRVEYFFNTDPGPGNGTNVSITSAPDISDLVIVANTGALNYGFNTFYTRSHSSNNSWSIVKQKTFIKQLISATNISKLEYYVDTDPGFGLGNNVSITPAPDISNIAIPVDLTSYSNGFHLLYVRSMDDNGNWTINNRWVFIKQPAAASNVIKLEYFVDTDPGFGLGTNVSVTPSPDISNIVIPVDLTSYSNGFHIVYVRSMDDNGNWTINNQWVFIKQPAAGSNVIKLEYFVDTDPGFGSGTDVAITASANVNDVVIPVNIASLSYGFHQLSVRSKDNAGRWSVTSDWVFVKDKIQPALVMGEYFFDTDPGFGNGAPIPALPQTANVSDFVFAADVSALPNAPHILFIRSLDDWSITNAIAFTKATILPVKLLNFFARALNKTSLLTWQTATESNNDRFEIEKSNDGIHYIQIGSVKGAGTSNILLNYSFTDSYPFKGINFYRLKQVDFDAKFVNSETRRVDFNEIPLFELLNNPSNGTNIIIKTNITSAVLNIFDMSGKKIQQSTVTGNVFELPVNHFSNGIYLAVLTQTGRIIAVEKFVISK